MYRLPCVYTSSDAVRRDQSAVKAAASERARRARARAPSYIQRNLPSGGSPVPMFPRDGTWRSRTRSRRAFSSVAPVVSSRPAGRDTASSVPRQITIVARVCYASVAWSSETNVGEAIGRTLRSRSFRDDNDEPPI